MFELKFNNPKKQNAIDPTMVSNISKRLYGWQQSSDMNNNHPRVLLLTAGEGHRSFCIGGDVTAVLEHSDYNNLNYEELDVENAKEYIMHL